MKKEVIFVLLNDYADWESAFLSAALNTGVVPGHPVKYVVKTLSATKAPVRSLGGFTTVPDYDPDTLPEDFAGLVLIGGMQWQSPEAEKIVPLVEKALQKGLPVGGICNASAFLGAHGFLDKVRHTSNTLAYLKQWAGKNYDGEANYVNVQAVRDGNIATANGTGYLEFTREMLFLLEADSSEAIEELYNYSKIGLCELLEKGK